MLHENFGEATFDYDLGLPSMLFQFSQFQTWLLNLFVQQLHIGRLVML